MASIERTAYPTFAKQYAVAQLQKDFKVTGDELSWLKSNTRAAGSRLALALLLKSFQYLRYFPALTDIPETVLAHIRAQVLSETSRVTPELGVRNTEQEYESKVLRFEEFRPFLGADVRLEAERIALAAAEIQDFRIDIINSLVEQLVRAGIELPAFRTLDEIAEAAHTTVERRVIQTIVERVSGEQRQQALELLDKEYDERVSAFNALKKSAGRATRTHLEQQLEQLQWLETFGTFENIFKDIAETKITYFGTIAKQLDAGSLGDYPEDKRLVCVLALIKLMQVRARDQLGEMFLKRIATINKRAKNTLETKQTHQRGQVDRVVATFDGVLDIIDAESNDEVAGRLIRKYVKSTSDLETLKAEVKDILAHSGANVLPFLWDHFRGQRAVLFRLLAVLGVEPTFQQAALMAAIAMIQKYQHKNREWLTDEIIDLSFCSARWRALVEQADGRGRAVNRRLLEVCVFVHVAQGLRSGDLAIPRSEEFSDYRKELLPWDECLKRLPEHCARIGVPDNAPEFVAWLRTELTSEADKLDVAIPKNAGDVSLSADGRPIVHKTEARQIPASAMKLRDEIVARMPQRHVMECLENAEHWLGFTRHFGPISGNEPKLEDPPMRYIQTVFAYGCNLGPAQAARHLADQKVTARMLSMANRRHVTVENLEKSLRELTEVYLQLDLPKVWGDGKTIAADGTQYGFFDDNLLVGMHFRYRTMGSVAYRHVTNSYIATFRHFIGPGIWEALYVIEGLLKAGLSVEADTVNADTQGQSASVFTYCLLNGINLQPRIRNWQKLQLCRPSADSTYAHIDRLFSAVADWGLIETGWRDVLQVAISIADGKLSSARLLRKLSSYSRRNKLYLAAQSMGEVIRTIYLLKWIGSRELRQEVTASTNKMESYNGFSKWVGFGGDVITSNDPDEQQKRLRYIDLVATSIVLQNAVDMTRIIRDIRTRQAVNDNDLDFLSPYLTEHIMRFGKYRVRLHRIPEKWINDPEFGRAAAAARELERKKAA